MFALIAVTLLALIALLYFFRGLPPMDPPRTTHYTNDIFMNDHARALCGRYVDRRDVSTDPSCLMCADQLRTLERRR